MREYQRLETGEGGGECYSSHPEHYSSSGTRPLQGFHLIAFIASLLFCLVVVVSFLWFLPCDMATCSAPSDSSPTIPWDRTYPGVEVYGGLHVVGAHLVVLQRAPLWGRSSIATDSGRLLGLSLASGDVVWYTRLPSNDSSLACPPDQPPLCFTLSKPDTLFAINPTSGVIAWKFLTQLDVELDFPIVIPDANQDGHSDLALIARKKNGGASVLVVSGGDGNVITEEQTNCTNAANLTFEKSSAQLKCDCVLSSSVTVSKLIPIPGVMSAKVRVRAAAGRVRSVISHGLVIRYRNSGSCPESCTADVTVSLPEKGSKHAWHYNESSAYLMQPLPIKFKPNLSGFLLKLWHWNPRFEEKSGLRVESITERIVLITFDNKMTPQVINASQTEITRLCNISSPDQCQPSIHSNTALITDVNGDQSQDLISYYVTYRPEESKTDGKVYHWLLESNMRVVRLEAELPKLYQLVSPH